MKIIGISFMVTIFLVCFIHTGILILKENPMKIVNNINEILIKIPGEDNFSLRKTEFISHPDQKNRLIRVYTKENNYIVKQTINQFKNLYKRNFDYMRFFKEVTALEFFNTFSETSAVVPRIYEKSLEEYFFVMEDLGVGQLCLIDLLTSDNRAKAITFLYEYLNSLAQLHLVGFIHLGEYKKKAQTFKLNEFNDGIRLKAKEIMTTHLKNACKQFHINYNARLINEVQQIIDWLYLDKSFQVLTHGDPALDNALIQNINKKVKLIDFEWVEIRCALLDVTYLRMGMPNCWFSGAIPNEVIDGLETFYRDKIKSLIYEAKNDLVYKKAYIYSCAFWVLDAIVMLKNVLKDDKVYYPGLVSHYSSSNSLNNLIRPRIVHRLSTFISVSEKHNFAPYLRKTCQEILRAIYKEWGSIPTFELYPVFKK